MENIVGISPTIQKKEIERFIVEILIETVALIFFCCIICGNIYNWIAIYATRFINIYDCPLNLYLPCHFFLPPLREVNVSTDIAKEQG